MVQQRLGKGQKKECKRNGRKIRLEKCYMIQQNKNKKTGPSRKYPSD